MSLVSSEVTIFYRDDATTVFNSEGAFELLIDSPNPFADISAFPVGTLALIESNRIDKNSHPPVILVDQSSNLFPVLSKTPRPDRFDRWLERRDGKTIVMNPWTPSEIRAG